MCRTRILVLDDEEAVRDLLVEALEQAGYATLGLAAGADALARVSELTPELILLDMLMPGMDGFEVLARLRTNPQSARIPLLIISALGGVLFLDADGRTALGVSGILTKPLHLPALIEHVRRIIGPGDAVEPHASEAGDPRPSSRHREALRQGATDARDRSGP